MEVEGQEKSSAVKQKIKPKNKDTNRFVATVNEQRFTVQLLKRKKKLQDAFERIETGTSKPQGHTFGMKTDWEDPGTLKSLLHSDENETAR